MENQEIVRQHLSNILGNIASIQSEIEGMNYETFRANEQTKEAVYSYLQEIGEAAFELENLTSDDIKEEYSLEALATLRHARYNQEAEIDNQNTWMILTNDLMEIGEIIEESQFYVM